jgi:hypothetical protein
VTHDFLKLKTGGTTHDPMDMPESYFKTILKIVLAHL